jgi:hypothetical protein
MSNCSASKRKNEQMGCIKLKCFYTTKETVTRLKRQPTEWKKIFANYSSNKGLISRVHRELKILNPQGTDSPMKKRAQEFNGEFSEEEVQMASKYMKKCSTSLAIKEMQIKTTLRFYLTPVKCPSSRAKTTTNTDGDAVNRNAYTLLVCMQISTTLMENSLKNSQNVKNRTTI